MTFTLPPFFLVFDIIPTTVVCLTISIGRMDGSTMNTNPIYMTKCQREVCL